MKTKAKTTAKTFTDSRGREYASKDFAEWADRERAKVETEFSKTVVDHIDGRPVTQGEMAAAFSRVQNSQNWKLPVDAKVAINGDRELLTVLRAITFFTGSMADATPVRPTREGGCVYHIRAAGYYQTIGA